MWTLGHFVQQLTNFVFLWLKYAMFYVYFTGTYSMTIDPLQTAQSGQRHWAILIRNVLCNIQHLQHSENNFVIQLF